MRASGRQAVAQLRVSGWALVGIGILAAPAAAMAVESHKVPLKRSRPAPLDTTIQRLSDVAFVSGHAPAVGGVILGGPAGPGQVGVGGPFNFSETPSLAVAMAQPLQPRDEEGLHLGGQVPVRTVGDLLQGRLRAMGVKDGETRYGGEGRFYLFAAVHGQAVGLNLQEQGGALRRTGWSTDQTSALVGDGQIGLGWRKGGMEAALGYVHRGVHLRNTPIGASDSYADDMGALSFTFHPHW